MVRISSLLAGVFALISVSEACGGWYQCMYASGQNCCVVDSSSGPGACPSYCDGGDAHPVHCIGQITGNSRHPCKGN
ncbi:hypothetical protein E4U43_002015 [Claviceps pusilla]|uniref:Uncharacterized protein n=1 Tax=Claviceps pusilla TaxID=123648 RepID=A0A9P7N989_9HYPO|nr:hypothetical protein E4U43_002015 [Claviceps pusilla]KAG6014236.1 hypothetical protein E4U54_005657 [Claviceps lovelessii]